MIVIAFAIPVIIIVNDAVTKFIIFVIVNNTATEGVLIIAKKQQFISHNS